MIASYDFGFKKIVLAVSLSYVYAQRMDDGTIEFIWETATESGNAGFNIFTEVNGQPVLLTEQMVPSAVIDSVVPVRYS